MDFKKGVTITTTTEHHNSSVDFQIGDSVLLQDEENDLFLFGIVGEIQGKKVKVVFDDKTEEWAVISKVKKVGPGATTAPPFPQPSDSLGENSNSRNGAIPKKKVGRQLVQKGNCQISCGSCGTQKMTTFNNAMEFSPYTPNQYNCQICVNKSKTGGDKNKDVPVKVLSLKENSTTKKTPSSGTLPLLDSRVICFHCRKEIEEKFSLQCKMCKRPCHQSCLELFPSPLPGDTFWSILCHSCKTQTLNDSSATNAQGWVSFCRNIESWSDVAHLLLNCIYAIHPKHTLINIDEHILPFWDQNLNQLHLPQKYKSVSTADRRSQLLKGLKDVNLISNGAPIRRGLGAGKIGRQAYQKELSAFLLATTSKAGQVKKALISNPEECSSKSSAPNLCEELSQIPPSYQKSKRDLNNVDSYYIDGSRTTAEGVKEYQVVWLDGQGFENTHDEDPDRDRNEYTFLEDYDAMEYFFDKMPCASNNADDDDDEEEYDTTMVVGVELPKGAIGAVKGSGDGMDVSTSVNTGAKRRKGKYIGNKLFEDDKSGRDAADGNVKTVANKPYKDSQLIDLTLTDSP